MINWDRIETIAIFLLLILNVIVMSNSDATEIPGTAKIERVCNWHIDEDGYNYKACRLTAKEDSICYETNEYDTEYVECEEEDE